MRASLMLLLLAGCSSSNSAAPPDLAAAACTFVLGGDTSGTRECMVRFCRLAAGDSLEVAGVTPFGPDLVFTVDGPFTARSYSAGDWQTFSAQLEVGARRYVYVGGAVAMLTVADAEWSASDSCPTGGALHGSALVELVESTSDDGGATAPGHVSVDATF